MVSRSAKMSRHDDGEVSALKPSLLYVPLVFDGQARGVMVLHRSSGRPFSKRSYLVTTSYAQYATMALRRDSSEAWMKIQNDNFHMCDVLLRHDVPNYISTAKSSLEMLSHDPALGEDQHGRVKTALLGCIDLSSLVEDYRNLISLASARPSLERTDIRKVIDEAVESIGSKMRYLGANIALSAEEARAHVLADSYSRTMFERLLARACELNGFRPVGVEIKRHLQDEKGFWVVAVTMSGKTLSNTDKKALLKRFQNDGGNDASSHGLCMSLVQIIADRYEGSVAIEDLAGADEGRPAGSVFKISLPQHVTEDDDALPGINTYMTTR